MVQVSYVSEEEFAQDQERKKRLYIIGSICLAFLTVLVGILAYISAQSSKNSATQAAQLRMQGIPGADEIIQATPSATIQPTPNESQKKKDILSVIQTVTTHIRTGTFIQTVEYIRVGTAFSKSEEGIVDLLRRHRDQVSEEGKYNAYTTLEDIQVMGNTAQVQVRHPQAGAFINSRFDVRNTPEGWKITGIEYNTASDIQQVTTLQKSQKDVINGGSYSVSPVTLTLPAGDEVEIEKTLFTSLRTSSGAHEDIELTVKKALSNYTVALYNGSYVLMNGIINKNDPGTHFYSFDIRKLTDVSGGSILFLPEHTNIDKTKPGKPQGVIFEIPIKLEL